MKAIKLSDNTFWVGSIDWDLRNFHGYLTPRGSTYNAFLVIDKKITLIDTVKGCLFDQMFERIKSIIDPAKIDYIVSNHVEMDHSGALPQIMKICPQATIIASPNGKSGLKMHYPDKWNYKTVLTGESISIGEKSLEFILTPMVHWPDSMATYLTKDKILFPNDAFGQHIASSERFDDEIGRDIAIEEAAKYYANIVLSYTPQVKIAMEHYLEKEIKIIATSHGIIWRKYLADIVPMYLRWANNYIEEKAVVIYDTMWGSTKLIAQTITDAFEDINVNAQLFNLQNTHISDIMTQLLTAKYICVGSPTLNSSILPTVAGFLAYMKGLAPKDRIGLAFGSYGWGAQSIDIVEDTLKSCDFQMLDKIKVNYLPHKNILTDIGKNLKAQLKRRELIPK